jgi:hypothetical protein
MEESEEPGIMTDTQILYFSLSNAWLIAASEGRNDVNTSGKA